MFRNPDTEGVFSGTLAEGAIAAADFVGPLKGLSFEEATEVLQEEGAYMNVHTIEYLVGKIRSQIEPVDPDELMSGTEPDEPNESNGSDRGSVSNVRI